MAAHRYAIYFTPAPDSEWDRFGAQWLGRDPRTPPRVPAGVPAERFRMLTASPRRYGFHATLKAPFRLREGATENTLLDAVEALAFSRTRIRLPALKVQWLDGFLALMTGDPVARLNALAAACVVKLDHQRAPPSPEELAGRRREHLDPRQEALLERWGYPHVLERWRFHMTLSDVVDRGETSLRAALTAAAWARLPSGGPIVDALSVLVERERGSPFSLVQRIPLSAAGRLFYLVGPSGAGKDSLLAWARQRVPPNTRIDFAGRTIARPSSGPPSDVEDARHVSPSEFSRLESAGAFALSWKANGSAYGIDRGIAERLAAGTSVVVNGSRAFLPEALRRFPGLEVIHVTADPDVIRQRLVKRGREQPADIEDRIRRVAPVDLPHDVAAYGITNDGALDDAGARLLAVLLEQ